MPDALTVLRVPALRSLSPAQMAAVALMAEGWTYVEAARLLGVSYGTFVHRIDDAAARIPGDLTPARFRAIAWWRGASRAVLGVDREHPTRAESIKRATPIYGGRCCLVCGTMFPHGQAEQAAGGHL